jgi:hypothetical protein
MVFAAQVGSGGDERGSSKAGSASCPLLRLRFRGHYVGPSGPSITSPTTGSISSSIPGSRVSRCLGVPRAGLPAPDRARALVLIDSEASPEDPASAPGSEQMHQAWLDSGPRPVREVVASIIFAVFLPGFFQFPPIGSSLKLFVADRSRVLCSSFAMAAARVPARTMMTFSNHWEPDRQMARSP